MVLRKRLEGKAVSWGVNKVEEIMFVKYFEGTLIDSRKGADTASTL